MRKVGPSYASICKDFWLTIDWQRANLKHGVRNWTQNLQKPPSASIFAYLFLNPHAWAEFVLYAGLKKTSRRQTDYSCIALHAPIPINHRLQLHHRRRASPQWDEVSEPREQWLGTKYLHTRIIRMAEPDSHTKVPTHGAPPACPQASPSIFAAAAAVIAVNGVPRHPSRGSAPQVTSPRKTRPMIYVWPTGNMVAIFVAKHFGTGFVDRDNLAIRLLSLL